MSQSIQVGYGKIHEYFIQLYVLSHLEYMKTPF